MVEAFDGLDQAEHRLGVGGALDPVDGDRGDLGTEPAQRVGGERERLPVLLDDDPPADTKATKKKPPPKSGGTTGGDKGPPCLGIFRKCK